MIGRLIIPHITITKFLPKGIYLLECFADFFGFAEVA